MPLTSKQETFHSAVVFYDGGCPLCSKEIRHYRNLSGADKLNWIDITENQHKLDAYNLSFESAMSRFHVLDAGGHWQTGAWGFVELWSHLRGYRWLAKFISMTRTQALLDKIYTVFASKRLSSRCNQSSCGSQ